MKSHVYSIEDLIEKVSELLEEYGNIEVKKYDITFDTGDKTISLYGELVVEED